MDYSSDKPTQSSPFREDTEVSDQSLEVCDSELESIAAGSWKGFVAALEDAVALPFKFTPLGAGIGQLWRDKTGGKKQEEESKAIDDIAGNTGKRAALMRYFFPQSVTHAQTEYCDKVFNSEKEKSNDKSS